MNDTPQPRPLFTASVSEGKLIREIALRAHATQVDHTIAAVRSGYGQPEQPTLQDWMMDIEATHCNGCPLDLAALASAPEPHFSHDIFGIRRHLDRETGKLEDHFRPRHARPAQATG